MEIKVNSVGNGMLIEFTDEEEGTEGKFAFTNQQEAYEKLAELMAELEMDIIWEDEAKQLDQAVEEVKQGKVISTKELKEKLFDSNKEGEE